MATVSSVPAELSSAMANVVSEMWDCALTPLALVPFCRRVTFESPVGEHGWLVTLIAKDRDMTAPDGTTTSERFYTWEAGACSSDPDDVVDFEEFARYLFETPDEALADATRFLAEHLALPEPISAGVA
jgi:hypothetical protein